MQKSLYNSLCRRNALLFSLSCVLFIPFTIVKAQRSQRSYVYFNKNAVTNGETLDMHISCSRSKVDIELYSYYKSVILVHKYTDIPGGTKLIPDSSFIKGCDWPVSFQLKISEKWTPGIYYITCPDSAPGSTLRTYFNIKPKVLGSWSKIAVLASINTMQAYNGFGGKSLYPINSTEHKQATAISLKRPCASEYDLKLTRWLTLMGHKHEIVNDIELDNIPNILDNYQVLIVSLHPEYWTRRERDEIQRFISSGGKVMFLSGNTCWWQVRYEDNRMVCYKNAAPDPLLGVNDRLATVNWYAPPLNLPENQITGLSSRYGGYVNYKEYFPKKDGYGDYAAYNTHHWIYNSTNLKEGDEFGWENAIVGYEVDGALFKWQNGVPVISGEDDAPKNLRILGLSPAGNDGNKISGHAMIGLFHNPAGGCVFNAGSIFWTNGLMKDSTVNKITKNVLNRFLQGKFPPDITSWTPFVVEPVRINNEAVFVNKRDIFCTKSDTLHFSIETNSRKIDGNTRFIYKINGQEVGYSSKYDLYNDLENKPECVFTVTAYAYNDVDTTSITWTIRNDKKAGGTVNIIDDNAISDDSFIIYPNPLDYGEGHLQVSLADRSHISLKIKNMLGQTMKTIAYPDAYPSGRSELSFPINDLTVSHLGNNFYIIEIQVASLEKGTTITRNLKVCISR